jgi:hypothetical protein
MKFRTMLIAASTLVLALVLVRSWLGDSPSATSRAAETAPRPEAHRRTVAHGPDRADDRIESEERRPAPSRLGAAATPAEELSPEERRARDDRHDVAQAALLTKALATAARDPTWSPQAERSVRDAFTAAALPGARLAEAACSATLCRVVVAFDSLDHRNEEFSHVIGLVRWPSQGFGAVSPDDPLRYVFYASRDKTGLPRAD